MRILDILSREKIPTSVTSRLDVELLLMAALQVPKIFLYACTDYILTDEQERAFRKLYARRLQGEPIAYILGKKEFWSLELIVNSNVLIPRPATEKLVDVVLQLDYPDARVVDLGTGSGAVALALATERPAWQITATDISQEALSIAQSNALHLQVANINFGRSDWCCELADNTFDVIVSNPPYIDAHDPNLLMGDVRFEPKISLVAGKNGLKALRQIIVTASTKLKPNGVLVLEHGYAQQMVVRQLLKKYHYQQITCYQDLGGMDRVIMARRG